MGGVGLFLGTGLVCLLFGGETGFGFGIRLLVGDLGVH
jgi:hypothetical protein